MNTLTSNTLVIGAATLISLIILATTEGRTGTAVAVLMFPIMLCVFNKFLRG